MRYNRTSAEEDSERLGELEQAVLVTVWHIGANAYGNAVRRDLEERTGRDLSTGAIYSVLTRLEDKALLTSKMSEPEQRRGGRRKRLYELTVAGRKSLSESWRYTQKLWGDYITE